MSMEDKAASTAPSSTEADTDKQSSQNPEAGSSLFWVYVVVGVVVVTGIVLTIIFIKRKKPPAGTEYVNEGEIRGIIEESNKENIPYLELRMCPNGAKWEESVKPVLSAIQNCNNDDNLQTKTRFFLCINRGATLEEAWATLELALKLRSKGWGNILVGLCLYNDADTPNNEVDQFKPVFEKAKAEGLPRSTNFALYPQGQQPVVKYLTTS